MGIFEALVDLERDLEAGGDFLLGEGTTEEEKESGYAGARPPD